MEHNFKRAIIATPDLMLPFPLHGKTKINDILKINCHMSIFY